jgi:hypothetical protein
MIWIRWKILALAIILLAIQANAFTETTTKYYAIKTFPEAQCSQQMLQAIEDAHDPAKWTGNQDLLPKNTQCLGLDQNCEALKLAEKYKQQATQTTDECTKAYDKGMIIHFYANAYNPANWYTTQEGCKTLFNNQIEEKIIQRETEFLIIQNCQNDQNTETTLKYTNEDQNRLLQNLKDFWQKIETQAQQEIEQAQATAEKMLETIKGLPEDPTEEQKQIATQIILDMHQYKCFLSETEEEKLYQAWKNLNVKQCLPTFLSGETTNYYSFTFQCNYFNANPLNPMQAAQASFYAFNALDEYANAGFATRECPTQQTAQLQTTTLQTTQPIICSYTPKNVLGCLTRFENKWNSEQTIAEDTTTADAFWGFGFAGLVFIIFYAWSTKP